MEVFGLENLAPRKLNRDKFSPRAILPRNVKVSF